MVIANNLQYPLSVHLFVTLRSIHFIIFHPSNHRINIKWDMISHRSGIPQSVRVIFSICIQNSKKLSDTVLNYIVQNFNCCWTKVPFNLNSVCSTDQPDIFRSLLSQSTFSSSEEAEFIIEMLKCQNQRNSGADFAITYSTIEIWIFN